MFISITIETGYRCVSEVNSSASLCQYLGDAISARVNSIQKVKGENQGIFSLVFDPPQPLLMKFNISQYFRFECPDAALGSIGWRY